MAVQDLDVAAMVDRRVIAEKVRVTEVSIKSDSAFVAWERGHLDGEDFAPDYSGNVHIEDTEGVLNEEGAVVTPATSDYTDFMARTEVVALMGIIEDLTKANAHDSEAWLTSLRAAQPVRRIG